MSEPTSDADVLRVTRDGRVARVEMHRPTVRNAMNPALIDALRRTFDALAADDGVAVVVLSGAGTAFSAGADIAWMRDALDLGVDDNVRDAHAFAAMYRAIDACPKAVVARVHGAALGGGMGLAAVADVVVAASDATFGFTEVKLGILPAVISPFVVAKIGVSHARALFVTGERFDAAHARTIGLVHHVAEPADLDARLDAVLAELASCGPAAVAASKAIVAAVAHASPADAADVTARAIAAQRTSPEGQEGLRAFLERRAPAWRTP